MTFKDHFSKHSQAYAEFRPTYPPALYREIITSTPRRLLAWDCATGNGQAATALSEHFEKVVATDASAAQIEHAKQAPNIQYAVASAESSGIEPGIVDLVTVAQALHWFDRSEFYAEVERVASSECTFAAWGYSQLRVSTQIDQIIDLLYNDIVGKYWPPERRFVESHYMNLHIPFPQLKDYDFSILTEWNLSDLCSYIMTWSSAQRFLRDQKHSPLDHVLDDLQRSWGPPSEIRKVNFPVFLRIGPVSG